MNVWLWIRLGFGLLSGLLAFHLVVLVDTLISWKLTLVAGEYGHRIALLALLVLLPGLSMRSWPALSGSVLLLASSLVLVWPLIQARAISRQLPVRWDVAFGKPGRGQESVDLSYQGLWFGAKPQKRTPETFVYAAGADGERRLHFFGAADRAPAPCIIVLHGGGWENGDPLEFPEWNSYWAANGHAVVAMEYRLAPKHRWPAPREDVRGALAWLKANADKLGLDPHRFILLGRSAGGQIATACAYGLHDPDIVGCVALYAPHDMFFARRFAFEDDVLNSLLLLRNYLGGDPEDAGPVYTSASGFMLAQPGSCPTLLIHGTRDTLVWNMQGRRLSERLRTLGVKHLLVELPWAVHGLDWPFDGPGGQITRIAVDSFLRTTAGK